MATQAGGLPLDGMPAWQRARRQRIVDAALAALERHEYEQIQIRDVAQAADVALGTLYRYFSSKEHLYAAVLQEWAALGRAGATRSRRRSAEARLRSRMHGVITAFERQPQFYKVHMLLQSSSDPNVVALMAEFAASARATLAEDLAVLGSDRAHDVATMLWSIINSMLSRAIHHDGSMTEVYRIADRFIDLLAPELAEAALTP
ncbi:TetR/AcrR family transcriptional regulator [Cryptosporangium minutisporangium]|uniref:HTH tetR-type domain-containing protein n=1 Tax=Cryptosporangium minutisporangium TaxID=113569 RepID=A0ABP6SQP6_9ACTN